uniref:Uncharacterized protein n=1 Tax=Candidatus Kentrum sp. DK TaxID=2126562 RepID=A0A450SXU1_9GAMM|nr:MAG: hypothetical protein BECKDK2373C_GA0170839_106830 [Candidatus Kentron sp. DK]
MTLEQISQIAGIISSIGTVIILAISATVAVLIYRWQRESAKIEAFRRLSEDRWQYNQLVLDLFLNNENLQESVSKSHGCEHLEKQDIIEIKIS